MVTKPQATAVTKRANDFLDFHTAAVADGSLTAHCFPDCPVPGGRVAETFGLCHSG